MKIVNNFLTQEEARDAAIKIFGEEGDAWECSSESGQIYCIGTVVVVPKHFLWWRWTSIKYVIYGRGYTWEEAIKVAAQARAHQDGVEQARRTAAARIRAGNFT